MEDYKEKYEIAIKKAKEELKTCGSLDCDAARQIFRLFPELKESEDDKIRKAILELVKQSSHILNPMNQKSMISWLEKQDLKKHEEELENAYKCADEVQYRRGYEDAKREFKKQSEQKSTDKIEPKFKNGQWIVWQDKYYKVYDNGCGYELVDQNGLSKSLGYENINKNTHLWNIAKDAKDGDVLLFEGNYNSIVLFQGIGINGKERINYHCKCDLGNYSFGIQGDVACLGTVDKDAEHYHPATKEQCDILFQKMKEAGYEWNAEKKELKKIEQKSAWSEEDEDALDIAIRIIQNGGDDCAGILDSNKVLDWLKSLKERVQPQPKKEWSEEDETKIVKLKSFIAQCNGFNKENRNKVFDLIDSIKSGCTWKPSDEQMRALNYVVNLMASSESPTENDYYYNVFKAMRTQLKKLKEE